MDKLVWNKQLNTGVEVIDRAHSNLFRIVDKLIQLVQNETNYQNACMEGLKYLEDYTMKHFSQEEAYMRSVRFRGYEKHKKIHDTFRDQTLVSLRRTLELSGYSRAAVERFLGVLLGWLTGHIMTEDQEISGELVSTSIYDMPSDTSSSMVAQAVNRAMEDMFRIKADLADDHYDGRSMGSTLYGRLLYDTGDGSKVQILLGIEERLIRRGVGVLFGLHTMQDMGLVHEVALQIFEQFLHHMSKLFRSDTTYQLCKEELLTRDEFCSDFMTRYSYAMLFETRVGYFAFCTRQWKPRRRNPSGTSKQRAAVPSPV